METQEQSSTVPESREPQPRCDEQEAATHPTRTSMDRFYQRIGMPMIDLGFSCPMKITLYVVVATMVVMWICLYLGAVWTGVGLSPQLGRLINGVILFIGAGLRLAAHNQPHPRWKFADFLGKVLAYYGAFTLLVLFAFT